MDVPAMVGGALGDANGRRGEVRTRDPQIDNRQKRNYGTTHRKLWGPEKLTSNDLSEEKGLGTAYQGIIGMGKGGFSVQFRNCMAPEARG